MVIRNIHPLKWWISVGVVLMVIAIAIPIGIGIWYTTSTVQHECTALNYLKTHPTRSVVFNQDISVWARSDGC